MKGGGGVNGGPGDRICPGSLQLVNTAMQMIYSGLNVSMNWMKKESMLSNISDLSIIFWWSYIILWMASTESVKCKLGPRASFIYRPECTALRLIDMNFIRSVHLLFNPRERSESIISFCTGSRFPMPFSFSENTSSQHVCLQPQTENRFSAHLPLIITYAPLNTPPGERSMVIMQVNVPCY